MTSEDIHAFGPPPAPTPPPAKAPRARLWPWLLGGLGLLVLATLVAVGAGLVALLDSPGAHWQVLVDDEPWQAGSWLGSGLGVAVALGLALLLMLVVLPLLLVVAVVSAASVALAVALALGAGLLALATVAAVGLSPLWLLGLLLWLALRPRRRSIAA
jgi:hypothetical protein